MKFICLALTLFALFPRYCYSFESSEQVHNNGQADQFTESTLTSHPIYRDYPEWMHLFTQWGHNYQRFFKKVTEYDAFEYGTVLGSTLLLLPFDQKTTDAVQKYSLQKKIMTPGTQTHKVGTFDLVGHDEKIFMPNTPVGVCWYFGDGLFLFGTAASMATYGYLGEDFRATHVSMQMVQAMMLAGPLVIGLKVLTGREAPSRATVNGGKWQGYPGVVNYAKDQSRYYAYPSGHTTTAVSMLTVLAKNYPEKAWLLPVGSTMVGLLMFSLMNVGSHWPSDYPLAIAIGYTAGAVVAEGDQDNNITIHSQQERKNIPPKNPWKPSSISPSCYGSSCSINATWRF